jgi:hypothetical protein
MKITKLAMISASAAVLTASLTGCSALAGAANGGTVLDSNTIENGIKDWFLEDGTEIETVECPSSMVGKTGDSWLCRATDPWGFGLDVRLTMTSSDGYVEWEVLY